MEDSADFQTINVDCDHSSVVTISGCSSPASSRCLSASGADSGDFLLVAVERCPLCLRVRVPLYCVSCLQAGKFTSTSNSTVRCSERREVLENMIKEVYTQNERVVRLEKEIPTRSTQPATRRRTTIQHLRDTIAVKQALVKNARETLKELQEQNQEAETDLNTLTARVQRKQRNVVKLKAIVEKKRTEVRSRAIKLSDARRNYLRRVICRLFRVNPNRPWTDIAGLPMPSLTTPNYHVLDSSDHTVAALLYASLFLRTVVSVLDLNLPLRIDTAVFAKELLTRDEVVLVYRHLVYIVQRLVGHVTPREKRSQREIVLADLVQYLNSPEVGRSGPFRVDRLPWVPTVNLEAEEIVSNVRSSEWVEVPWDIPYDAASTMESQFGAFGSVHGGGNTSFISSGASAISSWFGYAFGQSK